VAVPGPDEGTEILRARVDALEAELAALRDELERQARLADRLGAGGCRVGADGLTHEVSPGLCVLLGAPREALVGRPFEELTDPFCAARLLATGQGDREEREVQLTTLDGAARWVHMVASPVADGWLVRILDVTASRRRRVELQHAEALLTAAIEVSPAAIIVTDARTGEVHVANAAARELGGVVGRLGEEDVSGFLDAWDLRRADGTPMTFEELPIVRALAGEHVCGVEGQLSRGDGDVRWIRGSAAPIRDEEGTITGAILVVSDLTDRRAAERDRDRLREQVASARKAESLAIMAGAIAHDFNNALMAISGEAALAFPEVASGSATAQALARIIKSTEVAASLTRQLLAYAGRARLDVREREVSGLLGELIPGIERRYPNLELCVTCAKDLPIIRVDGEQLEQSLEALAKNAHEAGATRLEITARAARLDDGAAIALYPPGVASAGKYVCVFVSDDGPGMDQPTRERAFDPFYTTKGIGRGLGLAALAGVVGGHGGGVTIGDAPSGGLRFGLYLPALKGPPSHRAERPARKAPQTTRLGGRVLVVDDEAAVREVVARGLTTRGFDVLRAESGPTALRLLEEVDGEVDALVLDVSMPEMTGPALYASIRSRWRLPVLFMSGYAADDTMAELVARPDVDFAAKPFRVDELADRLRLLTDPGADA